MLSSTFRHNGWWPTSVAAMLATNLLSLRGLFAGCAQTRAFTAADLCYRDLRRQARRRSITSSISMPFLPRIVWRATTPKNGRADSRLARTPTSLPVAEPARPSSPAAAVRVWLCGESWEKFFPPCRSAAIR